MSEFNIALILRALTDEARRELGKTRTELREMGRQAQETGRATAAASRETNEMARAAASAAGAILGKVAAGAAAVLSLRQIAGATREAVSAAAEYERQMLTVGQVVRATGGAAGRSAQDIDQLAREIAGATLASSQGVRAAAAQLLTFRSVAGETFDRTLRAAQDLAAVGFGTVESAAVQLGRALEDPEQGLAALRRVGVSFTASQREVIRSLIETGRTAEAQGVILSAIEAQVGGAGAAAGSGLAGAFDAMTEATGRWFELVGRKLAEAVGLEAALRGIAGGIEAVNERLDPGEETRARNLQRIARALDALRAELERLESDPRTLADPLMTSMPRADLRARIAAKQAELDRLLAVEADAAAERVRLEEQAQEAAAQAARDRVESVIGELEREIGAIGQTELARAQLAAVQKAGVQLASEEAQAISDLVAQHFRLRDASRADDLLARLQDEATLMLEIARFGEDSVQVTRAREAAERRAFEETLRTMHVSEDVAQALREAWEAARGLAGTDMAGALAAARNEAQALAGEVARALGAAQALAAEGRAAADRAVLGAGIADPVERAAALAGFDFDRRTAAPAGGLDALERVAMAKLREEAVDAARRRAQAEQSALGGGARGGGGGGTAMAESGVGRLIASLQAELDIMREADPVRREMLRLREQLAGATDQERGAVEALISTRERERLAAEQARATWEFLGSTAMDALDAMIFRGNSASEVARNLARSLAQAAMQAAILGQGPLAGAFGGGGGLIGALADGALRRAGGGMIWGPGGPTDDQVLMRASAGEFVVNAAATARHRALLEAINAGAPPPAFARGGMVGGVPAAAPSMGSRPPWLVIENHVPAPPETRKERGPDGSEMVRVIVGRETARGGLDAAQRARFGVRPRVTAR